MDGRRVLVDEGKAKGIHSFIHVGCDGHRFRKEKLIHYFLEEFTYIPVLCNKGRSYPRVGTGY